MRIENHWRRGSRSGHFRESHNECFDGGVEREAEQNVT